MSFTSPLAIIVYVIVAILLTSTVLRRLTKEKFVVAIMRSSPRHRKEIIESYRRIVKLYKVLIAAYVIIVPVLIYLHFGPEHGEGILLALAGFFILLIIKAIEDIQYRNHVIARLESEQEALSQANVASIAQAAFETRARKWKVMVFVILIVVMFATIIAFYCTVGGPWWFYMIVSILMILAVAWGFCWRISTNRKGKR